MFQIKCESSLEEVEVKVSIFSFLHHETTKLGQQRITVKSFKRS